MFVLYFDTFVAWKVHFSQSSAQAQLRYARQGSVLGESDPGIYSAY